LQEIITRKASQARKAIQIKQHNSSFLSESLRTRKGQSTAITDDVAQLLRAVLEASAGKVKRCAGRVKTETGKM